MKRGEGTRETHDADGGLGTWDSRFEERVVGACDATLKDR